VPPPGPGRGDGPDERFTPVSVLSAIPPWLRPRVTLVLGHWVGRILLATAGDLFRVQIFDRAMTLAAQLFTSIFPILIMVSALLGRSANTHLAELLHLPPNAQRLISEALNDRRSSSFGLVGAVIVLLSATGLARALTRAYAAVWDVRSVRSGPRAAGRWLLGVILLAAFAVVERLIGSLTRGLPASHLLAVTALLIADCVLATLVPRLLLGGTPPLRKLVAGGCAFGLMMVAVRPAGSIYLPRALTSSANRYGTIGLAFTYIGWLYILSFCLLLGAVMGRLIVEEGFAAALPPRVRAALTGRTDQRGGPDPDNAVSAAGDGS
jgi:membrane protein